ncbi:class I SAM-dependent methyltransferase [Paenibacillaceae bacterium WGS1546]|uniref:class I SAM-dependent methyltransferase n=1 Tax=Cohnella sp. WGS1546 TaxID=3366810 RepID=UPI00372CF085
MKQNKYDDNVFFEKYGRMARSIGGLAFAGEWPLLQAMLPDLRGKRLLDLGCGYGWHCRYARERQARYVLGIDLSEKMLSRARELTDDEAIEYRRTAIEDLEAPEESFDVVLSSLALHYVEDFGAVCRKANRLLVPGGVFVFSVEHPIFTSRAEQDWHYGAEGEAQHWPVDGYHEEGPRIARFLEEDVVKYHRAVASYLNSLIDTSFRLTLVSETKPTQEMLDRNPEMRMEMRRPMFLLVSAAKG